MVAISRSHSRWLFALAFGALLAATTTSAFAAEVHFDNIYFEVGGEQTASIKIGQVFVMYVSVSNDAKDRKAFKVEWYMVSPDGAKSEARVDRGSAPGKHYWVKPYPNSFKGKTGGTVTYHYKLYTVTGHLLDTATRKVSVIP